DARKRRPSRGGLDPDTRRLRDGAHRRRDGGPAGRRASRLHGPGRRGRRRSFRRGRSVRRRGVVKFLVIWKIEIALLSKGVLQAVGSMADYAGPLMKSGK